MVESRNKTQGLISTDLNSRYGELVISPGIAKWGGFAEAVGAGKSALSLSKPAMVQQVIARSLTRYFNLKIFRKIKIYKFC